MPANRAAILRWTGRGDVSRLRGSVEYGLRARHVRARTSVVGNSVVVRGPDPIEVATIFRRMPGVSWIAAGFAESQDGLTRAAESLATKYLRPADGFMVLSEGTGGVLASDFGGAVTSRILEAVKGARVSETPTVKFRAVLDGSEGVVGVEVLEGPGGFPTGAEDAACLVSGGRHSSVVSWMAVLAGFRVKLVHAKVSDESLLAVARLYSELSNRADPRALSLVVLDGGSAPAVLRRFAKSSSPPTFAGFARRGAPEGLEASSPLRLMPEERFGTEFESLGVREYDSPLRWDRAGSTRSRSSKFAGGPADVSAVLDGLR